MTFRVSLQHFDVFISLQIVSAGGKEEAERKFETLLKHLSHPPAFTTVRVNTHLASVQYVKKLLFDELQKVCAHFFVTICIDTMYYRAHGM